MKIHAIYLIFATLILISSGCQKIKPERVIEVKTGQVSEVSLLVWNATGSIIDLGENGISQHGFCIATHSEPSLSSNDSIINLGSTASTGEFSGTFTGLVPGTIYYVRAFASDSDEPAYGDDVTFTTRSVEVPTVTTNTISNITTTTAQGGGDVTDDGGATVSTRGVCWSTTSNPVLTDNFTSNGSGTGSFTSELTGLDQATTYYVRAYATNSAGTGYGNELSFTTVDSVGLPTIITSAITNITEASAQGGGDITDDGGSTVTVRGVCWSTSQNPTIVDGRSTDGNGAGSFVSSITGLSCGTTYYARAYATNVAGTSYGNQVEFTTGACTTDPPVVTTTSITNITESTAQGGGNVTSDGGSAVTVRGVCWSTSQNPTISDHKTVAGSGLGIYSSEMLGLTCGTTYYVRAYATNASGTSYGDQVSFTTSACPAGLPVITTSEIGAITENSAQGGGEVTDDGGSSVTSKGVCWSTSSDPTTGDSKTTDGTGTGNFTSVITELECGTTYFVRAYAINSSGTAYGSQVSFSTSSCPPPTVTTSSITGITETTAQGGGNVTSDGGKMVTARGICWSTSSDPTTSDSKTTDGTGTGEYSSDITELDCGTTYYVRAYAISSSGTAYGPQVNFTTNTCPPPTVTTSSITDITETSAHGGGTVTSDGGETVSAKGVCWSTIQNPTISDNYTTDGSGTGGYTSIISGLTCGTTYYVIAYATSEVGTAYGNQVSFTTAACPTYIPTVTTSPVSNIMEFSAECGGEVTSDGGAEVTERGVCWSTSYDPNISDNKTIDGSGTGSFTSYLSGLNSETTFYVRAYATNSVGTGYGDNIRFTTYDPETSIADYDGNIYGIVTIGSQVWMSENLKVTHYADGTSIPLVQDSATWRFLNNNSKAFCWFADNFDYYTGDTLGALYTWAAAMNGEESSEANPSGVQGACPAGWHFPSDAEWKQLEMQLGMTQSEADFLDKWRGTDEGNKMKESGTLHWTWQNEGTNESGFTAWGTGNRYSLGSIDNDFVMAHYWTASEVASPPGQGIYRLLSTAGGQIWRGWAGNTGGYSIRCVKD